ncbi:MAG: hypothetical protein HRT92_03510 [Piscirickettsiaceae bacterium]|nr:hypothetical protein [Piscirickettsiaceae bacterium]
MKEIVDAIGTRIKSPYFGYSILAFIALNWREIFLILLSESAPQARILEFDQATSFSSLLGLPLLIGALVALLTPWVKLIFEYSSKKPIELIDVLKLEAQHKITIKQAQLEQSRTDFFAIKEKELIERARRDEEVSAIANEETKEKLSIELEQLRNERDKLSHEVREKDTKESLKDPLLALSKLSDPAIEILLATKNNKNGTIKIIATLQGRAIHAGTDTFGTEDQRTYVKYEEGLEELVELGLVKSRDLSGDVYELTSLGWETANVL